MYDGWASYVDAGVPWYRFLICCPWADRAPFWLFSTCSDLVYLPFWTELEVDDGCGSTWNWLSCLVCAWDCMAVRAAEASIRVLEAGKCFAAIASIGMNNFGINFLGEFLGESADVKVLVRDWFDCGISKRRVNSAQFVFPISLQLLGLVAWLRTIINCIEPSLPALGLILVLLLLEDLLLILKLAMTTEILDPRKSGKSGKNSRDDIVKS